MAQEEITPNLTKGYLEKLASEGKRIDGRGFDEFREIKVESGIIGTADGSAMATFGKTKVICGVKCVIGTPYPDSPDRGAMMTSVELAPLSFLGFEAGPPRENSIELARVVDRGIRESGMIDFEQLCIEEGEKIWMACIDLHIMDHGGNLFDCCTAAAVAALHQTMMPNVQYNVGEKPKDEKMNISLKPITCTFAKIGEAVVLDPNLDEEKVMSARLTVSHDENGVMRAMQKGKNGAFTVTEVKEAVIKAREKDNIIRKAVEESLK